jgi:hypothetical protein
MDGILNCTAIFTSQVRLACNSNSMLIRKNISERWIDWDGSWSSKDAPEEKLTCKMR